MTLGRNGNAEILGGYGHEPEPNADTRIADAVKLRGLGAKMISSVATGVGDENPLDALYTEYKYSYRLDGRHLIIGPLVFFKDDQPTFAPESARGLWEFIRTETQ